MAPNFGDNDVTPKNGTTNGQTNGTTNGQVNGTANGQVNGTANGTTTNGTANDSEFHSFSKDYNRPYYTENEKEVYFQQPMPLPPREGFTCPINDYKDVAHKEPRFDENVHLDLKMPEYVKVLPKFNKLDKVPLNEECRDSPFAYSSAFQVLSEEGIRIMRKIIEDLEPIIGIGPEHSRGNKIALRGLYYYSPFIRDFHNSRKVLDFFEKIMGERILPSACFSNVPQVNLNIVQRISKDAPLDMWHTDSVAFVGVLLLNDLSKMKGGELEVINEPPEKAMQMLENDEIKEGVNTEIVSYKAPGKMILAQGSEIYHHVRQTYCNDRRISVIMAFSPANCFAAPKSKCETMRQVDVIHNLGDYEFFRERCWQAKHALEHFTLNTKYTNNGKELARKMRSVCSELMQSADILDGGLNDVSVFFDEVKKTKCSSYGDWRYHCKDYKEHLESNGSKKEEA